MRMLDRFARILAVCLLFVAWSDGQAADFAPPTNDGWYSWQVEGEHDLVRIFVRMRDGEPVRLRMRDQNCWQGDTPSDYTDLGVVANTESIAWLKTLVGPRTKLTEQALFALAAHDGDEVIAYFDQLISQSTTK